MVRVSLDNLHDLIARTLVASHTSLANARAVASALVSAEADGQASHGASRAPFYADQALCGKVDGMATPVVDRTRGVVVRVDARDGFAFPAVTRGLEHVNEIVRRAGLAAVGIANSHHFGVAGYHVEPMAEQGLLALAFSNSPAAIAPWGGAAAVFGTNPIAMAAPREQGPPLVVDLSLGQVARGKIILRAKRNEPIPEGWALDAEGRPTTDPTSAVSGTLVPIGGAKGAALALVIELLTGGLTGSNFGYEADSFFNAKGSPPRIGQLFLVFDPLAFSAGPFPARVEDLLREILRQPGTRLPGERRLAHRARARAEGLQISEALFEDLQRRAGTS